MDDIADALEIDETKHVDRLAGELVRADTKWIRQLVDLRKLAGLSQAQVARLMGRSQSVVSDIETMSSDPRLSSLRRYALAIGAVVGHIVLPHPSSFRVASPNSTTGALTVRTTVEPTTSATTGHGRVRTDWALVGSSA